MPCQTRFPHLTSHNTCLGFLAPSSFFPPLSVRFLDIYPRPAENVSDEGTKLYPPHLCHLHFRYLGISSGIYRCPWPILVLVGGGPMTINTSATHWQFDLSPCSRSKLCDNGTAVGSLFAVCSFRNTNTISVISDWSYTSDQGMQTHLRGSAITTKPTTAHVRRLYL